MDYLQIANSWPVWLCAGACVAFIVVQAVAFAKLCYKNAPLVGLSKADCSKSFQCGMVTAIGPSLSCFIGAISMITVVGGPLAWMRLSMIGAAPTELTAATTGAAAYGVELGGAGYDIYAMANSWLTMALNGCGWLLVVVLLTPRMESLRQMAAAGCWSLCCSLPAWKASVKRSAAAMKSGWALSPAPLPLVCSATWLLSTTIRSLSIPLRLGPASPAPLSWSPASSLARRCPGSRNTALALPS